MTPSDLESRVKQFYNDSMAQNYRTADENKLETKDFLHFSGIINNISSSFNKKISVLDLGCGTGLYFHRVENVEKLVGVDVSQSMLDMARNPIKADLIQAENLELLCSEIYKTDFPPESFDFIYSIGVLGEYSPLETTILEKMYGLLRDGGKIYFTVMDVKKQPTGSLFTRLKLFTFIKYQQIIKRKKIDKNPKIKKYPLSRSRLKRIIDQTRFKKYTIDYYQSPKDGWKGAHYEVFADK